MSIRLLDFIKVAKKKKKIVLIQLIWIMKN